MGPEQNSDLFNAVAGARVEALTHEFMRRNLLGATLKELSELFEEKDNTSHPVTEPTLLGRLWALTQVQRSHMGLAGFEPQRAIDYDGSIAAKSAPHHDEFVTPDGQAIRTRIIKLTMPDDGLEDTVDIFGLNLYQPDVSTDEFFSDGEGTKLVIVGEEGRVKGKEHPITGETVAFAVRNKQTGDAKLYKVAYTETPEDRSFDTPEIKHESESKISVSLPDETTVEVELLDGQLQRQVVDELQAAISELKKLTGEKLSVDEKHAVTGILQNNGSQEFDFEAYR